MPGPQVETENNGETETPGNNNSSRCKCNASCTIARGNPKPVGHPYRHDQSCPYRDPGRSSRSSCSAGPITYEWKIGESGKDVAEIVGKNDQSSVTVKEKKEGNYTLYLSGTVTCSDGTFCVFGCNWEQTVPPPGSVRACMPSLTHDIGPLLDGGLVNYFRGAKNTKLIRRDDFVALEAAGSDIDLAIPECKKLYQCPDAGCDKQVPITGRVRFEWTILPGKGETGSLVQIGCIPDEKNAKGEHVIFKPPFIPLPVTMKDTTVVTEIELAVIDDGSPVGDPTVNKTITIKTTRKTANPDFYEVEIDGGGYKPAAKTAPSKPGCACKPIGPDWTPGNDLKKPDIILPKGSSTNNKIVLGQWMILTTTDQRDKDLATYTCLSASSCPTANISREYEDIVLWNWTVKGGGEILFSHDGQYVIYAAPLVLPEGVDSTDITITLKVYNTGGRVDPEKSSVTEKIIRVYRPGIKLSYPPKSWLPEDTNHVSIKSELVYRSGKGWLPALDHMCRILYFELLDISHEKGICMNDPVLDKADECFDLQLEPGDNLEAFSPADQGKEKCSRTDLFLQGRTVKPVKEHTLKVRSLDFGAYGFLRSFANINYGISITRDKGVVTVRDKGRDKPSESPLYTSIPWLKGEVPHPLFNGRGKTIEYTDNRVTLPYDADENHVADAGWTTAGDVKVDDPPFVFNVRPTEKEVKDAKRRNTDLFPDNDRENLPLGDGFRGDGLGSYEEYRGFRVKVGDELKQVRTNPEVKDIFIYNPDDLPLKLYKSVSGLDVYEINEDQFGGTEFRYVNFNHSPATHIVDQRGLFLAAGKKNETLLGIALTDNGKPATPNFVSKVVIYREKIDEICTKFGLNPEGKLAAVIAHELLHANNVCHHGEGNEAAEQSHDVMHGLRSGDIFCVMHYDNSGKIRDKNYIPEPTGTRLCTTPAGTGYNLPANNTGNTEDGHLYFGDALEGRGACTLQIRISARGERPTQCGNRFDQKGELKKEFKR
ncbi:MAG: hypothetical protein IPI66_14970 [Chitinophagaceae bacterium]|nr:hypothetical protein [Chitinophagaceae bacterium]